MSTADLNPPATTAADPLYPLDSQLCFSVYSLSIAINRTYKPLLDALELTYPQYLVMSALWEQEGLTVSAIASRLALEPSTITPLVKRLEQAGFALRQRSSEDERQVHVSLTDSGRALHSRTGCLARTLGQRSGMTGEELIELNRQIKRLLGAIAG